MKLAISFMLVVALSPGCSKDEKTASEAAPKAAQAETKTTAKPKTEPPDQLGIEVVTSPEQAGAVNSVLLVGANEVVIVDAQFTKSGANMVADAAEKTGKNVSRVFITHAHPDHYLGTAVLKQRFPNAKFIAVPSVVAELQKTAAATAKARKDMLGPEFPGEPVIPEIHQGDSLSIDGTKVQILKDQKGDTHSIALLYIESQGTLIASDVAYVDVHLWTATTDHDGRMAWATQTKELEKLPGLKRVIPGHQLASSKHSPELLAYTRAYIRDFDAAAAEAKKADDLLAAMKKKYPDAKADLFLQIGSQAAFAPAH